MEGGSTADSGSGSTSASTSDSNAQAGSNSGSGSLSLDITDAPVDSAEAVNVVFTGVELKASGGTKIDIVYDEPRTINLLDLQGGATAPLLEDETLAAGDYQWIRLQVDATDDAGGSYILLDDGSEHDLFVPGGAQTGLKLVNGFTVPDNGVVALTIDFDLRKSIVATGGPNPTYRLKPVLRLINNSESSSISGSVSSTTVASLGSCDTGAAIYVYEGADVTPGDVGGDGEEPLVTAMIDTTVPGETNYEYTVAFLEEGDYTIAFTCDGDLDDPEADDAINMTFTSEQNVTVSVEEPATAEF
jgi:hypothetical protein